ncbi:hypothetical protein CPB86DRAFT_801432 [Serendipita vermifera]|nr:hypothetical protein CPB86DRAFT_801432 [Serendipita vermifera]
MTLELSNPDDEAPKGVTHIILEFSLNGNIIQKVNLLSRDSISEMRDVNKTHQSPTGFWRSLGDAFPEGSSAGSIVFPKGSIAKGCTIWSTDEKPRLSGLAGELEISAWIEINDDGRQLLGSTKLNGRDLYELIGKRMGRITFVFMVSN